MAESICLSCRYYDPRPDLAGDLPEIYGLCLWPLPERLPAVILGHVLRLDGASRASRMLPKRGLAKRPDLYRECPAHEPAVTGERREASCDPETGRAFGERMSAGEGV